VTDEDGAILGGVTRSSRWAAVGVAVHIGSLAPPWGEGEDEVVLLQQFPLQKRQQMAERTRKATTAMAKMAAAEATETTRTHSRHINITKHIIYLIHLCLCCIAEASTLHHSTATMTEVAMAVGTYNDNNQLKATA